MDAKLNVLVNKAKEKQELSMATAAEILLNQQEIFIKQQEQDEVLAALFLNQLGGVENV